MQESRRGVGLLLQKIRGGRGCSCNQSMLDAGGFGAIPEDSEVVAAQQLDGGLEGDYQRRAEEAVRSWKMGVESKMGDKLTESQTGPLALSSDNSTIDLKDFLSKRGKSEQISIQVK